CPVTARLGAHMSDTPLIDPAHAALLVMDYQPSVLAFFPAPAALLARVADAIKTARQAGVTIAYVRGRFEDSDYSEIPSPNKALAPLIGRRGVLHADAPETAIHGALAPDPEDLVVRKTRVGAFSTTDLDRRLRDLGITTLILAGIHTS